MLVLAPNGYGSEKVDQLLLHKPGLVIGPVCFSGKCPEKVKVAAQCSGNRTSFFLKLKA